MSQSEFNYRRTARLIDEAITAFDLDLSELSVYTEAATGGFAATAATAIAAGAETVYALAENSSYGSAADARTHTKQLAKHVGDEQNLVFPEQKRRQDFAAADIVTNTGFVRPIDNQIVDWLDSNTSVPLMYEPWEFRADDMDIDALWDNGNPVLGTDESDSRVETQQYLQPLAAKIMFECNLEIYQGAFIIVGDGRMARRAADLEALGATVVRINPNDIVSGSTVFDSIDSELIERLDALVVVDHDTDRLLVGEGGLVNPHKLSRLTRGATVIHICGSVSASDLDAAGLRYVPEDPAPPKTMSYNTGYLGPRPIVDLHAAGLRVGADLVREQRAGADFQTAMERIGSTPLGMDFDEEFKQAHGFYE